MATVDDTAETEFITDEEVTTRDVGVISREKELELEILRLRQESETEISRVHREAEAEIKRLSQEEQAELRLRREKESEISRMQMELDRADMRYTREAERNEALSEDLLRCGDKGKRPLKDTPKAQTSQSVESHNVKLIDIDTPGKRTSTSVASNEEIGEKYLRHSARTKLSPERSRVYRDLRFASPSPRKRRGLVESSDEEEYMEYRRQKQKEQMQERKDKEAVKEITDTKTLMEIAVQLIKKKTEDRRQVDTPVETLSVPLLIRRHNEGKINNEQLLVLIDRLLNGKMPCAENMPEFSTRRDREYNTPVMSEERKDAPKRVIQGQVPLQKLSVYDGENMPLESFLSSFRDYAETCEWSETEKLFRLRSALTGQAAVVKWKDNSRTAEELIDKLEMEFGNKALGEKYREQLMSIKKLPGQSIRALHGEIKRLMALAYPVGTSEYVDTWGKTAFLNAFQDAEFVKYLRMQKPQTLADAFNDALLWEVNYPPKEPRADHYREDDRRRIRALDMTSKSCR